ncbi:MAG: hypothetical protein PHD19_11720 [Dechloromonas sp.]|nr:hypothetical protein [Dechloromonas sp.]
MKVRDLIAQLQQQPPSATAYVLVADPETNAPLLYAVAGVDPARSPAYGTAVVIELED